MRTSDQIAKISTAKRKILSLSGAVVARDDTSFKIPISRGKGGR
jgi:hypothetical protein